MGTCRHYMITQILLALPLAPVVAQQEIDTLLLRAQTYYLTHDLLEGRSTGTPGADLAAEYIASECMRIGLVPVGNEYTQSVPLEEATITRQSRMLVNRSGQRAEFRYPTHFTPNVGSNKTLVNFEGPAVYVGPASDVQSGTVANVELRGMVAVVLGARITTEAAAILSEAGAVAIVHLLPNRQTYDLYQNSRGPTRLYHQDPTIESSFLPSLPSVLVGPQLTAALLADHLPIREGEDLPLGPLGVQLRYEISSTRRRFDGLNVACVLPGSDDVVADTAIVFTAHYDHLGVGLPDSVGDTIYNGFADNAAGVAMLLGIADAMARDESDPARHSMLFLFLVGEERGLLGSDYYVARPLWPLECTRAVINIDGGAPPGLLTNWRLAGVDSTGLGGLAISVADARGWQVTTSPPRANSDYYPFVREGIPGVFIIPGPGAYEGITADSSDAVRDKWGYYHHVQDEWTADFPFSGLQRYAEFGYLIARRLDSGGN